MNHRLLWRKQLLGLRETRERGSRNFFDSVQAGRQHGACGIARPMNHIFMVKSSWPTEVRSAIEKVITPRCADATRIAWDCLATGCMNGHFTRKRQEENRTLEGPTSLSIYLMPQPQACIPYFWNTSRYYLLNQEWNARKKCGVVRKNSCSFGF